VFRRIARAIPLSRAEGGQAKLASTFKFEFRGREDPRFVDRRMQSLLATIQDNLVAASPSETTQILHALVKLRLPADELINDLLTQIELLIKDLTPKDIALVLWSLARINYPKTGPLFS